MSMASRGRQPRVNIIDIVSRAACSSFLGRCAPARQSKGFGMNPLKNRPRPLRRVGLRLHAVDDYVPRPACWGSAAGHIVEDLHLPNGIADLKWAATAFSLSYALFEIPTGWLGDAYGPKKVMIRILLWWSIFTALTGTAGQTIAGITVGLGALVLIRFLFGMGEAGAYPNITRALHNWFPFQERGIAQGAVWMSGRMMGGLTPMIWLLLVEEAHLSWRTVFMIFGAVGVIWCILFGLWFRNRPDEKATVNQAEQG